MSSSATEGRLAYRGDIDGLRAVAVIVVLLYHAKVASFSSGYVGVDVFFVISGYLITQLILSDLQRDSFSLREFYYRRVRRIFPALLLVIATSLVVGAIILLPHDYVLLARSAAAALLFSANILFWRETDYFGSPAELKPLLHTWSLGVEEQFYIVFPILLYALRRRNRRVIAIVLATLGLLSFGLGYAGTLINKVTPVFYMAPTRAWELLLGAVIVLLPPVRAPWLAAVGTLLIVGSAIAYPGNVTFPVPGALLPCAGAALVIIGRSQLLALFPLRRLGEISYALYLWHWPVLVYLRYWLVRDLVAWEKAAAIALIVALSFVTWQIVERPARGWQPGAVAFRRLGIGVVAAIAMALAVIHADGLPKRFPERIAALNAATGDIYKCDLTQLLPFGRYVACGIGLEGRPIDAAEIVLWGDSFAQMYAPALQTLDRPMAVVSVGACAPTEGYNLGRNCAALGDENLRKVLELPADIVVMGLAWHLYTDRVLTNAKGNHKRTDNFDIMLPQIADSVRRLQRAGKRVIVIAPIAIPRYDVPSELARAEAFDRSPRATHAARAAYEAEYAPVLEALRGFDATIVRPDSILCDATNCWFVKQGTSLFADKAHLSQPTVRNLAPLFTQAISEAVSAVQSAGESR